MSIADDEHLDGRDGRLYLSLNAGVFVDEHNEQKIQTQLFEIQGGTNRLPKCCSRKRKQNDQA